MWWSLDFIKFARRASPTCVPYESWTSERLGLNLSTTISTQSPNPAHGMLIMNQNFDETAQTQFTVPLQCMNHNTTWIKRDILVLDSMWIELITFPWVHIFSSGYTCTNYRNKCSTTFTRHKFALVWRQNESNNLSLQGEFASVTNSWYKYGSRRWTFHLLFQAHKCLSNHQRAEKEDLLFLQTDYCSALSKWTSVLIIIVI